MLSDLVPEKTSRNQTHPVENYVENYVDNPGLVMGSFPHVDKVIHRPSTFTARFYFSISISIPFNPTPTPLFGQKIF